MNRLDQDPPTQRARFLPNRTAPKRTTLYTMQQLMRKYPDCIDEGAALRASFADGEVVRRRRERRAAELFEVHRLIGHSRPRLLV